MIWHEAQKAWVAQMRSPDTQHIAKESLKVFSSWFACDLEALSIDILEAYVLYLADRTSPVPKIGRHISMATMNRYLQGLKLFLRFCGKRGWITLPLEAIEETLKKWPASASPRREILTREERVDLLNAAANQRDRCLLALGLYAGLRNKELCQVLVGHIGKDLRSAYVYIERGKGNKSEEVPIDENLYALLRTYAGNRAPEARMWVISPSRVNVMVKQTAARAGIPKHITTHSLRHTYAFWLAKDGTPVPAISKLLRHSNLAITTVYIDHLTREDTAQYAPVFPAL